MLLCRYLTINTSAYCRVVAKSGCHSLATRILPLVSLILSSCQLVPWIPLLQGFPEGNISFLTNRLACWYRYVSPSSLPGFHLPFGKLSPELCFPFWSPYKGCCLEALRRKARGKKEAASFFRFCKESEAKRVVWQMEDHTYFCKACFSNHEFPSASQPPACRQGWTQVWANRAVWGPDRKGPNNGNFFPLSYYLWWRGEVQWGVFEPNSLHLPPVDPRW